MSRYKVKAFEELQASHLVNVEDITIILQAQKEAAWSEVARRLAHEIKNPLTPIKLSAERMTMKYGNLLLEPDKKIFKIDQNHNTAGRYNKRHG